MSLTPLFSAPVAYQRGWSRGGGVFLVAWALLLASGCATKGDLRRLQDEVGGQATRQEAQLRDLSADIRALQDSFGVQSALQSEMVVDTRGGIARELRDMQTQLSQLTALTGQIQRSLVALSERVRVEGMGVTTSDQRADPDSLAAVIGRGGTAPVDCDAAYEAAIIQFNRSAWGTARQAFGIFLENCHEHPLAPRAQFNLASALEEDDRLDQAIEEFLRVRELYPSEEEVPMALYRIALIYVRLGNEDEAVVYLERVIATYPGTDMASLAEAELREIR